MKKGDWAANIILFLTLCVLIWATIIASNEYKTKNKPLVGITSSALKFMYPKEAHDIVWDAKSNQFIFNGEALDLGGCEIDTQIQNVGSEPALDVVQDVELFIGGTSTKTTDQSLVSWILMPNQGMVNKQTISKEELYDAMVKDKKIKMKYKFTYTDLSKKKNLYEYSTTIVIDREHLFPRSIEGNFTDGRRWW